MPGSNFKTVARVSVVFLALGAAIFATSVFSVGLASIRLASMPGPVAEIVAHTTAEPRIQLPDLRLGAGPVREASVQNSKSGALN